MTWQSGDLSAAATFHTDLAVFRRQRCDCGGFPRAIFKADFVCQTHSNPFGIVIHLKNIYKNRD